jgi:membrane protein required for colicin V production
MELHNEFNNFDYAVLGIILLTGLLSLMRGVVREIFSLIAWGGAFFAGSHFYPLAQPWTERYISNPTIAKDAAWGLVAVIAFIVLQITGGLIAKLIKGNTLTAIDRSLGFVFGLAKGALIVCIVFLMLMSVLWSDLDPEHENAAPAPNVLAEAPPVNPSATVTTEPRKPEKKPSAPEWIMNAKTRPFLAYGARELKDLIPADTIDSTAKKLLEKREATQKDLEETAGRLIANPGAVQNLLERKPSP